MGWQWPGTGEEGNGESVLTQWRFSLGTWKRTRDELCDTFTTIVNATELYLHLKMAELVNFMYVYFTTIKKKTLINHKKDTKCWTFHKNYSIFKNTCKWVPIRGVGIKGRKLALWDWWCHDLIYKNNFQEHTWYLTSEWYLTTYTKTINDLCNFPSNLTETKNHKLLTITARRSRNHFIFYIQGT